MVVEPDIWRRRAICFFASQCVTLFGSQIVQFAVVWYVTLLSMRRFRSLFRRSTSCDTTE